MVADIKEWRYHGLRSLFFVATLIELPVVTRAGRARQVGSTRGPAGCVVRVLHIWLIVHDVVCGPWCGLWCGMWSVMWYCGLWCDVWYVMGCVVRDVMCGPWCDIWSEMSCVVRDVICNMWPVTGKSCILCHLPCVQWTFWCLVWIFCIYLSYNPEWVRNWQRRI